jgi:ATP synthase protein I
MSPTSYQTAPPRSLIITADEHQVKRSTQRDWVRRVHRLARSVSLLFMADERKGSGEPEDDRVQSGAVLWARYSQIAFIIPASVVVGLLVGKLLDYWFHTHWLFLVGVILGAIAGFVDLIRTILRDKNLKSE